jgi:Protein of unknown function (DUF1573)
MISIIRAATRIDITPARCTRRRILGIQTALGAGLGLFLLAPAVPALPEASAPATAPRPGPVMEVRQTSQDGGTVEEGTVLKYRFTVANRGPSDLEISQVKPSCGCTVPHWDRLIPPGKEGVIDAEVHTEHFRGAILKHLTVISNDPQHPELELSLTAKITPLVQVEPGPVALLSVDDKPVSQVFTLERTGGHPMKIVQVSPVAPYLKTDLAPLSGDGRYRLTVTATTDTPMGRSPTPILVKTDLPKGGDLVLTVIVDRGIVTTPPMVYWSVPPGELKAPVQGVVTITRAQHPFHVKSVTVDDPKLQTNLQTVREGQEYQVTVTYAGGWTDDRTQKTLTVTTDDPKQPELKVPVMAIVQRPLGTPQPLGAQHSIPTF